MEGQGERAGGKGQSVKQKQRPENRVVKCGRKAFFLSLALLFSIKEQEQI